MAVSGRKQMTYAERKQLFRNTPNEIRPYNYGCETEHSALIESFDKTSYRLYEQYLHKWGTPGRKRQAMLEAIIKNGITGSVRQLAKLRVEDLYQHQKLIQVLRHRWTGIAQKQKDAVNMNTDKFWFRMAGAIQRRCEAAGYELDAEWCDRAVVVEFLKAQYSKQAGVCAISGELMQLQIGSKATNGNKCSPDRRDSDRGYEPGNVWLVCWWVNQMKLDMPMQTFWHRVGVLAKRPRCDDVRVQGTSTVQQGIPQFSRAERA
jgi:hypothetical protein